MQPGQPRRLLAFCDGTWCGAETNTNTNIQMLAESVGIKVSPTNKEVDDPERNLKARYFDGIGLNSTFVAYLFNGTTANEIGHACKEVYTWIAENFRKDTEIWMFGLSRGAYTVRCVAGMINNCGIVKNPILSDEVYKIYTSAYEEDKPNSPRSIDFREKASWRDKKPVKILGLLDTVGSIGAPDINSGNGPAYATLWDQVVSDVVETVFHACSIHDRLSLFQPCLTRLPENGDDDRPEIIEKWFPGCHYDLGRQKFKFLRQKATNPIERMMSWLPNLLSKTLEPNPVLSDLVLHWMLESINKKYPQQRAIMKIDDRISHLERSIVNANERNVGSGDVYRKPLGYAPFGTFLQFLPTPIADSFMLNVVIRDRRIPNQDAQYYDITKPFKKGSKSIKDLGKVNDKRYPSKTLIMWKAVNETLQRNGH